jgi:alkylhydroperoxidase family enzyme
MLDAGIALLGLAVVAIVLCAVCVVVDRREARAAELWYKKQRTHDGIRGEADFDGPFELIGPRPEDERPAGVDWSISTWASERGQYDSRDRGFKGAAKHSRQGARNLGM